eukprot:7389191-Prymnesium_polylepis.3
MACSAPPGYFTLSACTQPIVNLQNDMILNRLQYSHNSLPMLGPAFIDDQVVCTVRATQLGLDCKGTNSIPAAYAEHEWLLEACSDRLMNTRPEHVSGQAQEVTELLTGQRLQERLHFVPVNTFRQEARKRFLPQLRNEQYFQQVFPVSQKYLQ